MTAQEVFLAFVTVRSSVLSCCSWPRSPAGQHTNTFLEPEINGAQKEVLGLFPQGKLPQLSRGKTQTNQMTHCKECSDALFFFFLKKSFKKLNN